MEKPGLGALAVKWSGPDTCPCGHAHHHIGGLGPTIMALGHIVDDLVETTGHKIGELHFNNGLVTHDGESVTRSKYGGFGDGGISDTSLAELLVKIFGDLKHTAVFCYVLTHEHGVGKFFHRL